MEADAHCHADSKGQHAENDNSTAAGKIKKHLATAFCGPCRLISFLRDLHADFGGYVLVAPLQYGVNQGMGMTFAELARKVWFATDKPKGLGLDGATGGRLVTAASFPWNVKPIFGMLSDALPLCGYHRTPYVIIAGIGGVIAYVSLGSLGLNPVATVPLIALVNLSVSIPDVMIDGRAAELTGQKPEHASDLQSLQWGSFALGGFIASCVSGWLVDNIEPRKVFFICVAGTLSILVPTSCGFLGDQRVSRSKEGNQTIQWFRENRSLVCCALFMSTVAMVLSVLQVFVDSVHARFIISVICAMAVVVGVFFTLRRISSVLAKTAVFIFLRQVVQPSIGEAVFQWSIKADNGPKFTLTFLGLVDAVGFLGLFTGILLYQRYLTKVSYRWVFAAGQVVAVLANLLDLVLIKRWNLSVGLPDQVFVVGDTIFTTTIRRFFDMPVLVLAAQVCPENIEATLFALLMSLTNMGDAISNFLGTSLLELLDVTHCDYSGNGNRCGNLDAAVLIKSLCRCLPLLLIPVLVPGGSPSVKPFGCAHNKDVASNAEQGDEKIGDHTPVMRCQS